MSTSSQQPPRIVLAKVGLDGHDRGMNTIAKMFVDAGMEVIHLGLHNAAEDVARVALQEDADAVGISSLSGEHLYFAPQVAAALEAQGAQDVLFFMGGVIPWDDIEPLKQMGVDAVFPAGSMVKQMVSDIEAMVAKRRAAQGDLV